jgi:hypothetical protein
METIARTLNRLERRQQSSIQRQKGPLPRLDRNDRARLITYVECIARETRPQGDDRGYCRNRVRKNGEPWAKSQQGILKKVDVAVIKALLNDFHHSGTGECYPAIETIAAAAACSPASVARALPRLERTGLVQRYARTQIIMDAHGRRRARRTSNSYGFARPSTWFWPGNTPLKGLNSHSDGRSPYDAKKYKNDTFWPNGRPTKKQAAADMKAHLERLDRARHDDLVADENIAIAKIRELKARGEI